MGWVCVALVSGCANPQQKATRLLERARGLYKEAQERELGSYSEALQLYTQALATLDTITSKFPKSQVAASLTRGQAKIGPYTLREFKSTFLPSARIRAGAEEDPLACALLVARTAGEAEKKARALTCVGGAYWKAGKKGRAAQTLSEALLTAQEVKDESRQEGLLWFMQVRCEFGGDTEDLRSVLARRRELLDRTQTTGGASSTLTPRAARDYIYIADKYADIGDRDVARQLLGRAVPFVTNDQDVTSKYFKLGIAAEAYAKAGDFGRALEVARQVQSRGRATALAEIASRYAEAGDKNTARNVLREAVQAAEALPDRKDRYYHPFMAVARAYARAGLLDEAVGFAERVPKPEEREWAMADVAVDAAEAGQVETALGVLRKLHRPDELVRAACAIAVRYARGGDKDQARRLLGYALQAGQFKAGAMSTDSFDEIVHAWVAMGEKARAAEMLAREAERAEAYAPGEGRAIALSQTADQYLQIGYRVTALDLLRKALQEMTREKSPQSIADSLAEIGATYGKAHEKPDAKARRILHDIIRDAEQRKPSPAGTVPQYPRIGSPAPRWNPIPVGLPSAPRAVISLGRVTTGRPAESVRMGGVPASGCPSSARRLRYDDRHLLGLADVVPRDHQPLQLRVRLLSVRHLAPRQAEHAWRTRLERD